MSNQRKRVQKPRSHPVLAGATITIAALGHIGLCLNLPGVYSRAMFALALLPSVLLVVYCVFRFSRTGLLGAVAVVTVSAVMFSQLRVLDGEHIVVIEKDGKVKKVFRSNGFCFDGALRDCSYYPVDAIRTDINWTGKTSDGATVSIKSTVITRYTETSLKLRYRPGAEVATSSKIERGIESWLTDTFEKYAFGGDLSMDGTSWTHGVADQLNHSFPGLALSKRPTISFSFGSPN